MTLHEIVTGKVLANAHDAADARLILDPPPATLRTEDVKVPTPPDPWSSPRAQAAAGARPANCTTPPGLRDLLDAARREGRDEMAQEYVDGGLL